MLFCSLRKLKWFYCQITLEGKKIREKDEFISGREEEFWEEWDRKKNFITTHIKHFNLKFFKISVELKGKKKSEIMLTVEEKMNATRKWYSYFFFL